VSAKRELRIGIDARLRSGSAGGVESVIIGLASGLSRIAEDAPERYFFMTYSDSDAWLQPFVHGRCTLLHLPPPPASKWHVARAQMRRRAPWLRQAWRALPVVPGMAVDSPPRSNGIVERAGMDVMHFPSQNAFLTDIPSIYHPHDLQHIHLPKFFSARERTSREANYKAFCRQASVVVVTSRWARDDLIRHYQLPPEKVSIVPWAPVVTEYPPPTSEDIVTIQERLTLPDRFILYPAQTWPHKNHLRLIEALAILKRDRGLRVPLVASGYRNAFHRELERRTRHLGVEDQVYWVGFVSPLDLQALYRIATAVVIPTLFEAASGPLWDAFASGVAAACSNVTSLPEQADGAALIFDPSDPVAIADAIARLWTDSALRTQLVEKGRRNVSRYSWEHTARLFRAHYRHVSGGDLTDDDRDLLSAPAPL
jgi:glycosyltransferase involved in cell wall biosynthesis